MDNEMKIDERRLEDIPTEELTEEQFLELVLLKQEEALQKARLEKNKRKTTRPFPKWIFWLMAFMLTFSTFSAIVEIYSIPAVEFLKTSAKLSQDKNIATYKKAVVVVSTNDGKGTGFSISPDGTIVTNNHVIEDKQSVVVVFPEDGRFHAEVVETFPAVDLAILQVEGKQLPHLQVAKELDFIEEAPIRFIGNPLYFNGIANEGTMIHFKQLPSWDEPVMMIQAPVYRGNSGSPVFNEDGEVIGIIFATLNEPTYGKVGLFVPVEELHKRFQLK